MLILCECANICFITFEVPYEEVQEIRRVYGYGVLIQSLTCPLRNDDRVLENRDGYRIVSNE